MVQTVFTNRCGKNSLTNIILMFAQMACLLISSTAITDNWEVSFVRFILPMALISFILLLQYMIEFNRTENLANRLLMKQYIIILGIRSVSLFVAVFIPYQIGLIVAVMGVLLTWILPGILVNPRKNQVLYQAKPINFPLLVERLSLLVIVTFGEMVIGISSYFTAEKLSIASFLVFLIVASLFMIYIVEIDHLVEVNQENISGNSAIYYHYLIFFGLSFTTVSLDFMGNQEVLAQFSFILFYLGIYLFMFGVFLLQPYNKITHRFTKDLYLVEFGLPLIGLALSFIFQKSALILASVSCIVTLLMMAYFVRFNIKKQKESQKKQLEY